MANIFEWMRDGASRDAAVDGSGPVVEFEWENTRGKPVWLTRMLAHYVDTGTFDANLYGNNIASSRWTFARSGRPLYLPENFKLRVSIQDNMTGLTAQYFMVQGFS